MIFRPEYPRPDFDRSHRWLSLNGEWDFAADPDNNGLQTGWEQPGHALWSQQIHVPFAWESSASHIEQEWLPVGWYRRIVERPSEWADERIILHIGAAHYLCQVWLNGQWIGEHIGGYLPFSFDVTDALDHGQGEVIIRVEAPLDKRSIPHGKQRSRPADDYNDCAFTATSGIWQSVWLEGRPATYIEQIHLRPTDDLTGIHVRVTLNGTHLDEATLSLYIQGQARQVLSVQGEAVVTTIIPLHNPHLWTPKTPHLYTIIVQLESADGRDRVGSYTGLRKIEVQGTRFLLNGQQLYIRGVLDQGYWPESGYTAPDDAALRRDVELALEAGYTLARKHIKLEDPRWLYWADTLGLLVWAEPPCVGRYSHEAIALFESQLAPMVARDGNHPSIVLWCIYNEEWGLDWQCAQDIERQGAVKRAYDLLSALDESRPIIDNSGWSHVKTDVLDWHYYDNDIQRWNDVTAALVADAKTWFGHQLAVDTWYETQLSIVGHDHNGLPLMNGEYGGGISARERGWHLRWQTQELRRYATICGYIYTELYDVEHELAGIYTADRQHKQLGCDPAATNADTTLIFDLVPKAVGCDYITTEGVLEVDVRISHHGSEPFQGTLVWGWSQEDTSLGSTEVRIQPYEIGNVISLRCSMPNDLSNGQLHVQLTDENNVRWSSGFLDIATAPRGRADTQSREERRNAFSETALSQVIGSTENKDV